MSAEILKEVKAMRSELRAFVAMVAPKPAEEWVPEKVASKLAGISIHKLRKLRYAGKVGRWRCDKSTGRSVQYLKSDLESLFQTT